MFLVKLPGPHKLMRSLCGTLYAPCLVSTVCDRWFNPGTCQLV